MKKTNGIRFGEWAGYLPEINPTLVQEALKLEGAIDAEIQRHAEAIASLNKKRLDHKERVLNLYSDAEQATALTAAWQDKWQDKRR